MSDPTPSSARLRATVQYDGAGFHGSQLQPDVRTVQGTLEEALSRLLDRSTRVELAGRTDAGVHAAAQEIAFDTPPGRAAADVARGLGALLPEDLGTLGVREARDDFHPRFDATGRRYEYLLAPGLAADSPFLRDRCWRVPGALDPASLAALAGRLAGERAFDGFAKAGQPERGTRCRVEEAAWRAGPGPLLRFTIVADRFLHHMVRYLVGTQVEIARGRRPADDLDRMLEGETPSRPVYPAPPGGLYLTGVRYEEGWNRPAGIPWLDWPA